MRIVIETSLEFAERAEKHFAADWPISYRDISWSVVEVNKSGTGLKPARITLEHWEPK